MNNGGSSCARCGRALEDYSKFGLCADCVNKLGTPLSIVGMVAVCGALKKYGPRLVKLAITLTKR